jgi:hypothetical protein
VTHPFFFFFQGVFSGSDSVGQLCFVTAVCTHRNYKGKATNSLFAVRFRAQFAVPELPFGEFAAFFFVCYVDITRQSIATFWWRSIVCGRFVRFAGCGAWWKFRQCAL